MLISFLEGKIRSFSTKITIKYDLQAKFTKDISLYGDITLQFIRMKIILHIIIIIFEI